ncbi:hypothetical protein NIES4101_65550 [Calothrix sp. NIES-4101]|nr:hypothetical protein NIES4101_65550 [Calothrix sp. NIES-4101]
MKTFINSTNNIRWNRMLTLGLSISILLFTQACAPQRLSMQSHGEIPVNHSLEYSGN